MQRGLSLSITKGLTEHLLLLLRKHKKISSQLKLLFTYHPEIIFVAVCWDGDAYGIELCYNRVLLQRALQTLEILLTSFERNIRLAGMKTTETTHKVQDRIKRWRFK